METQEIWKDVIGYEGLYQVSNLGNVRTLNYKRTGLTKLMTYGVRSNGYYMITLCTKGKVKTFTIHKLIAMAFLQHTDSNGLVVDHIDNNKLNNSLCNLQLITPRQNNTKDRVPISGFNGVRLTKYGRYRSSIELKNISISLGNYLTPEEASEVVQKALLVIENVSTPEELKMLIGVKTRNKIRKTTQL